MILGIPEVIFYNDKSYDKITLESHDYEKCMYQDVISWFDLDESIKTKGNEIIDLPKITYKWLYTPKNDM